jgi:S4 domain protein YaaA
MKTIRIQEQYITLGQLLKLCDCISTGGQAKMFLREVPVWVNGEREQRRGRKLYEHDVVSVEGFGEFQLTR